MKRIVVFLLIVLSLPLFAEEISSILLNRKRGSINFTISGGLIFSESKAGKMTSDQLENYLWGTASSLYDEVDTTAQEETKNIEIAGDYYLNSWFGLHASIAYEKRVYTVTWYGDYAYGQDAVFSLGVDYLNFSFGGRLFFGKFYFGVEGYCALPLVTDKGVFIATHQTNPTHSENPEFKSTLDYGAKFTFGWRWRWFNRLFCDIGFKFVVGFAKNISTKSFTPVTDLKNRQGGCFYIGLSYAIQ